MSGSTSPPTGERLCYEGAALSRSARRVKNALSIVVMIVRTQFSAGAPLGRLSDDHLASGQLAARTYSDGWDGIISSDRGICVGVYVCRQAKVATASAVPRDERLVVTFGPHRWHRRTRLTRCSA